MLSHDQIREVLESQQAVERLATIEGERREYWQRYATTGANDGVGRAGGALGGTDRDLCAGLSELESDRERAGVCPL